MKKVVLISIIINLILLTSSCATSKCAASSDHLYAQNHKKNQKYNNRSYVKKVSQQQKQCGRKKRN